VQIIGLRYCNVYGDGEEHKGRSASVISQMYRTMRKGKKFKLFKDGEQRRDWIYVKDVVEANMLAMKYDGPSDIFNIGTGWNPTFNEVASEILCLLNNNGNLIPEFIDCPFPEKYQSNTCCNIEKARTHLGFSPQYDVAAGLDDLQKITIQCEFA
jgi:ADP-L-glycero-D-manno-heptose 6-epimerase